ncbi:MAG: ATP-binding cassette domain-containing protein [Oligoflexia bacterium]|nr:ATP-binding cassette domain-containing protein [Oligoflexia bacterium]MBF0364497.1 ATP-binding cassette domain-containing protein [Oligoflexia bacterium]
MKRLLRYLYPYVRPYWKLALIALFLSLPFAGIKGVQVWLVKHVVNTLTPHANFMEAFKLAMALLGLAILNYPCRFFHFYLMRYVIDLAACLMRNDIYKKLQRLPLSFFVSNKSGALISNILNDTRLLADGLKSAIDIVREPLTAMVMFGMALYSDWHLTLVILIVAPLFILIFVKSGRKVRGNQEEVQEQLAHMTHAISEGIGGQKISKAFNLQDYIRNRFQKVQERFFRFQMKTAAVEENAHPLVELVGALAFAGVILYAQHRISIGAITPGDFFSFVTALALMMDPLRKYSQANVRINQARAAGERLFEILALPEEQDEGTIELKEFKDKIEFDRVTFRYKEGEAEIVRNLSLTIRKGERVGIVGLSGAGKSTIINLLLRLYRVRTACGEGEIRIDGINIEKYTLQSLRQVFGLVSQDLFLFHDTVQENICVGHTYTTADISRALTIAGAKDFVEQLPLGIATMIGDRGTRLSGGQCQRLTIARAVLRNPAILLFDEATSALDNASEKEVQAALDRWSSAADTTAAKTVIAVAHRLTTIQNYDQIVVMRDGEVIEQGKHDELMGASGEYYKLYDLSMRGRSS